MYIEDKRFEKMDFKEKPLARGDYDNCQFIHCDFANTDLSDTTFSDCEFVNCNLSLVKLTKTAFRDVVFKDCKMLGLLFDQCSEYGLDFRFDTCLLNHSSFYKTKIKKMVFKNTQLHQADFTDCDASNAIFDKCDLTQATFDNTILIKADFRTAYNYSIDPERNHIKKARFSLQGVLGLLDKYDIEIDNNA